MKNMKRQKEVKAVGIGKLTMHELMKRYPTMRPPLKERAETPEDEKKDIKYRKTAR